MAQQTIVEVVDDLDGSSGDVETVKFGLDGVDYDIDLNGRHADQLRGILGEFVPHARRAGGRLQRGKGPHANTPTTPAAPAVDAASVRRAVSGSPRGHSKEETRKIREWAYRNGYTVADRGRIPVAVLVEYNKAQEPRRRRTPSPTFTG